MQRKQDIGASIDTFVADIRKQIHELVQHAQTADKRNKDALMRQATSLPSLRRAQMDFWIAEYNGKNGDGSAQAFLASCLVAAGSATTLAQISAALSALEAQALAVVNDAKRDGWDAQRILDEIDPGAGDKVASFDPERLPIPPDYVTPWGTKW